MIALFCLLPLLTSSAAPTALDPIAILREDLSEYERTLRDPKGDGGREAVQALAKIATPEAWALILEALRHLNSMVADEAQIALGGLAAGEVLEELWGKQGLGSKSGIVAERVAEALGRMPLELDAADLAKALKAKDAAVRRMLLWSIERQAPNGRVVGETAKKLQPVVEKLSEQDKDDGVRAAAVLARCALEPDQRDEVVRVFVTEKSPECRIAAALAASALPNVERRARVAVLATDPLARVRWALSDVMATTPDRDDVGVLVEMLAAETVMRNAWHYTELLQRLSGLKHRNDPRPWIEWQRELPEDWEPLQKEVGNDYGDRTASLVGMPILSDRVCIVIDLSGSTWEERDGKTRKQVLDVELKRALEALPAGTRFNLIPYTVTPHPWKQEVVEATQKNVEKALEWFEGVHHSGQGNFWSAWQLAVSDPGVDTVMALTDGAPTGGDRWNLQLMGPLLEEQNRFRRVVLDAVIVDAKGRLLEYWTEMCAKTGGRMTAVNI
jgi:HEAT repeat protein